MDYYIRPSDGLVQFVIVDEFGKEHSDYLTYSAFLQMFKEIEDNLKAIHRQG